MKNILKVFVLIAALSLVGCGATGPSNYSEYTEMASVYSTSQNEQLSQRAKAIAASVKEAKVETKGEKTLLSVIAMMQIANLQYVPLGIEPPTTWEDVTNNNILGVARIVGTSTGTYFLYDFLKEGNVGGTTTYQGDVKATGSFNKVEQHTTYSDGSASDVTMNPIEDNSTPKE